MGKSKSFKKRRRKKAYERKTWPIIYLNLQHFLTRRDQTVLSLISPDMKETIGSYAHFEFKVIDNIINSQFLNLTDRINLISISKETYFYNKNTLVKVRDELFCEKCPLCQQNVTYDMKRRWTRRIRKFFKRGTASLPKTLCCESRDIYQYYHFYPSYYYERNQRYPFNLELKFRKPIYSELNMKKKMFTNVKNPITQSLFHYFRDLHTDIMIENNKKILKFKRDRRLIRGY